MRLLARTGELSEDDARQWRALAAVEPQPGATTEETLAVGIFAAERDFVLARAQAQNGDPAQPVYEYIPLSRQILQQACGDLEPFLSLAGQPLPVFNGVEPEITPLEQPTPRPWPLAARQARFEALLRGYAQGDINRVLTLLAAALDERGLLVLDYPGQARERVHWLQGLLALLPSVARPDLTFATHTIPPAPRSARVVFAESRADSSRWIAGGEAEELPSDRDQWPPYVALLAERWQGDSAAFMKALLALEPLADALLPGQALAVGLSQLTEHVRLEQQVIAGEDVPAEALKEALKAETTLPEATLHRYAERLLALVLESRDTEGALLVALQMDANPALDTALTGVLQEALETQPDAVYVYVRTRLNDAMEADTRWIERLQLAALLSLRVAITSADPTTIASWLKLISREPASYGLSDVLRGGIFAAREYAYNDGDLARQLLVLAVRRDPQLIDRLLDDEALVAAVPDNLGRVLRQYDGDMLMTLQNRGPEMFLVAAARAARAQSARMFNAEVIDHIWRLYTAGQTFNLPAHYQPESIVERWISDGAAWQPPELAGHILRLMLADTRDTLFQRFAASLAQRDMLTPLLVSALQNSQRSIADLLTSLNQLVSGGSLTQQQAANTYIELLNLREWRQNALPLVEQLARMMQQSPTLDIPLPVAWRLLETAATARSDQIARVAARQLFSNIETRVRENATDEASMNAVIEILVRLFEQVQWSSAARQSVLNWWRDFVRGQPIARLSKMDKALEGKRALEDCRTVLLSTLSFRRMLGKRSISDFARDINTAFSVLEDLADSFDPSPRRPASFDEDTIRADLDAQVSELSDQERRVLAANFRELGQLIGEMGDRRSKGNLMRQNIDRQLMAGEQQPDSAVDMLKWLAGYLDGAQGRDTDEDG